MSVTVAGIRRRANAKEDLAWCAHARFRRLRSSHIGEIATLLPIFWLCWKAQCKIAYQGRRA